jgi:hypothetical protein
MTATYHRTRWAARHVAPSGGVDCPIHPIWAAFTRTTRALAKLWLS